MKFKTIQEAFNHYRTASIDDIERRAAEIKTEIETSADADMDALNIEIEGLKQAKANQQEKRGQPFCLGQNHIVLKYRVNIGAYIFGCSPTGGAVLHVLPVFLCILPADINSHSDACSYRKPHKQVKGMEAGHERFKRQR